MNLHHNQEETWLYRYRPHYPRFEQIPHYYGDLVRGLLVAAAILVLAGAPFYTDALGQQLPYLIVAGVVAVALAALTNPRSETIMLFNALLSGLGAVVFEYWALWFYQNDSAVDFALRQAIALVCMFAFYFALKTLRSMLTGQVGKEGDLSEFEDDAGEEAKEEMDSFNAPVPEDGLGHVPAVEDDTGGD